MPSYNPNSAIIISIPFNGIPDNANRLMVWDVEANVIQIINTIDNSVYAELSSTSLPYKVYTALLTQSKQDNPIATILENTLGRIDWARGSFAGIYTGTLNGAFVVGKTWVNNIPLVRAKSPLNESFVEYNKDVNTITIITSNQNGTPVDDLLNNSSIEIRVYN